jgi:hypothetical protein
MLSGFNLKEKGLHDCGAVTDSSYPAHRLAPISWLSEENFTGFIEPNSKDIK